jgi:exosortase
MNTDTKNRRDGGVSAGGRESFLRLPPYLTFSILAAASLAIWWRSLAASLSLALHEDAYTQILLVLPVTIALIIIDWKSPEPATDFGLAMGSAMLAASALLRFGIHPASSDAQLSLSMLVLVVWWTGAFLLSFGVGAVKRAVFPLCFLLWIIPIPQSILNPVTTWLQNGSVASARFLFAIFGVPIASEGTRITLPGLTIEVAPECSSIRSSLMLVVTTMVVAHLLLRSAWRKVLVIAVAIPLSVAKNGLRIFVLAMLATRVDRSFITGRLHREGGIIYFLLALALIFLLVLGARRSEEKRRGPVESGDGI